MSRNPVQRFLDEHAPDLTIIDHGRSTTTVTEAAATLNPHRVSQVERCSKWPAAIPLALQTGDATTSDNLVADVCSLEAGRILIVLS